MIVLSRLRKLDSITGEIAEQMPITYDIEADHLYKKGIEQGLEKGIEQGLEKGIEQGKRAMIVNMLKSGNLTIDQIAEISQLPKDIIFEIQSKL